MDNNAALPTVSEAIKLLEAEVKEYFYPYMSNPSWYNSIQIDNKYGRIWYTRYISSALSMYKDKKVTSGRVVVTVGSGVIESRAQYYLKIEEDQNMLKITDSVCDGCVAANVCKYHSSVQALESGINRLLSDGEASVEYPPLKIYLGCKYKMTKPVPKGISTNN